MCDMAIDREHDTHDQQHADNGVGPVVSDHPIKKMGMCQTSKYSR
jgi:hypothetical protein